MKLVAICLYSAVAACNAWCCLQGPNEFSHMQGQALGELKEEMKSVKALLLSR